MEILRRSCFQLAGHGMLGNNTVIATVGCNAIPAVNLQSSSDRCP